VTVLPTILGRLCCWLGAHAWEYPNAATGPGYTPLLPTQRCRRCEAVRDIRRDS
jgi:hypothetical protein